MPESIRFCPLQEFYLGDGLSTKWKRVVGSPPGRTRQPPPSNRARYSFFPDCFRSGHEIPRFPGKPTISIGLHIQDDEIRIFPSIKLLDDALETPRCHVGNNEYCVRHAGIPIKHFAPSIQEFLNLFPGSKSVIKYQKVGPFIHFLALV